MRLFAVYCIGLLFGVGIAVSGMINPAKVLNFFDIAGAWDASLAFVMGGALAVTFFGYRAAFARGRPLMGTKFHFPGNNNVDLPLIGGSALFGIGWGIAGVCPGAALPALGTGRSEILVFVGALLAGLLTARTLRGWTSRSASIAQK